MVMGLRYLIESPSGMTRFLELTGAGFTAAVGSNLNRQIDFYQPVWLHIVQVGCQRRVMIEILFRHSSRGKSLFKLGPYATPVEFGETSYSLDSLLFV
jgi:hypothetical protein